MTQKMQEIKELFSNLFPDSIEAFKESILDEHFSLEPYQKAFTELAGYSYQIIDCFEELLATNDKTVFLRLWNMTIPRNTKFLATLNDALWEHNKRYWKQNKALVPSRTRKIKAGKKIKKQP
jgi:hypothetical protein